MLPQKAPTTLRITDPLVLYRSLLATKKLDPDPAQHRLALRLQKLYQQLKDYEPAIEYKYRLSRLNTILGKSTTSNPPAADANASLNSRHNGIFPAFSTQDRSSDVLALTKKLTDHEFALQLQSPKGLLLHGEVGTGKSLLVDLLADSLPNRKKQRLHFNTFMLEIFAKLEQLRVSRSSHAYSNSTSDSVDGEEHSLLWLAREIVSTSPILFLDEFQLPDRVASKILSTLFTSFFNLGGVLIATSNRMPEELAKASGIEFIAPSLSRLESLRERWGFLRPKNERTRSDDGGNVTKEFGAFLQILV